MSKIVVDQVQKTGGTALTLPAADGTAGQSIVTDGSGTLSFSGGDTGGTETFSKTFTFGGNSSSSSSNKAMWTDIKSGITLDEIITVRMTGHMRCSSNFQVYAMGLNSSGNTISSGYLGYGYEERYNGNNDTSGDSHNSNNGHIWFPGYTTIYSEGQSYGDGIMFDYLLTPKKLGSYAGHNHLIMYTYQQDTSYNHPNHGRMAWNNYSTNTPPDDWHGIIFYPNSGTFESDETKCRVHIELLCDLA